MEGEGGGEGEGMRGRGGDACERGEGDSERTVGAGEARSETTHLPSGWEGKVGVIGYQGGRGREQE